tara:strand:- start:1654 stop:2238 length:585 start_codon:yes stop_codon:yes gene_type:complete
MAARATYVKKDLEIELEKLIISMSWSSSPSEGWSSSPSGGQAASLVKKMSQARDIQSSRKIHELELQVQALKASQGNAASTPSSGRLRFTNSPDAGVLSAELTQMQKLIGGAIREATGEVPALPNAQGKVMATKRANRNDTNDYVDLEWRVKELELETAKLSAENLKLYADGQQQKTLINSLMQRIECLEQRIA